MRQKEAVHRIVSAKAEHQMELAVRLKTLLAVHKIVSAMADCQMAPAVAQKVLRPVHRIVNVKVEQQMADVMLARQQRIVLLIANANHINIKRMGFVKRTVIKQASKNMKITILRNFSIKQLLEKEILV